MENVKNNMEKYNSYREQTGKFKKAMSLEFYYEAIFISYAIMEDRLISFLDHIGLVTSKNAKLSKRTSPYVRYMLNVKNVNIKNISTKIDIIKHIINLTPEESEKLEERFLQEKGTTKMKGYITELSLFLSEKIDSNEIKVKLEELNEWIDKRNRLIHGLLNKRTDDYFTEEVRIIAENSEDIWRFFDSQLVSKVRKCDLRKKYKIQ